MSGIRLGRGVTSVELDDIVYAAQLPDGPVLVLEGVGAMIWQQLGADAEPGSLSDRVAGALLDPPADLDAQIEMFLQTLRAHGLLAQPPA